MSATTTELSKEQKEAARLAQEDVFNDETTQELPEGSVDPEDAKAAKEAEEALKRAKEGEGATEGDPDEESNSDATKRLAAAVEKLAASQGTPKVEEAKAEDLTPEQINKLLNRFEVTDELLTALDDPATRKATLQDMLDAAAKHGGSLASAALSGKLQELESRLEPLTRAAAARQQEQAQSAFFEAYPILKDDKFTEILDAAAAALAAEGIKPKTSTEANKLLAERVEKVIQKVDPTFTLKPKATQSSTQTTNKHKTTIPKLTPQPSGGGQGGGGAGGKTSTTDEPNRTKGVEVFD